MCSLAYTNWTPFVLWWCRYKHRICNVCGSSALNKQNQSASVCSGAVNLSQPRCQADAGLSLIAIPLCHHLGFCQFACHKLATWNSLPRGFACSCWAQQHAVDDCDWGQVQALRWTSKIRRMLWVAGAPQGCVGLGHRLHTPRTSIKITSGFCARKKWHQLIDE